MARGRERQAEHTSLLSRIISSHVFNKFKVVSCVRLKGRVDNPFLCPCLEKRLRSGELQHIEFETQDPPMELKSFQKILEANIKRLPE